MAIYIITKNPGKKSAALSIFKPLGIEVEFVDKEYLEIQADTSLEIARYGAVQAARDLGQPAIREDHSLFIHALNFPGPYTNYFEKRISCLQLLQLMSQTSDRSGHFELALVYAEPNGKTKDFIFTVPITLSTEERGTLLSGWARLLMLEGDTRTLAEYPEAERTHVWNKNYQDIADLLVKGQL